jgi:hypothetical protein
MTIAQATFQNVVDALLSADNDEFSEVRRSEMIKAAVERYSHDRPDEITEDETGDGGNYYATSGLASWSEGFSRVLSIQYPAPTVASDEAPVYLEPEDWDDDYWDGSIRYIYLPNHAPANTEAMRVRYTAPYAWTSGATDVPAAHFYAVCNLAAGLCAQAIAQKYSRTSDSTISLDSVDHLSRAQQWAARARELIKLYEEFFGLSGGDGEPKQQAAGEFVDMDTAPSWPSARRYLYH